MVFCTQMTKNCFTSICGELGWGSYFFLVFSSKYANICPFPPPIWSWIIGGIFVVFINKGMFVESDRTDCEGLWDKWDIEHVNNSFISSIFTSVQRSIFTDLYAIRSSCVWKWDIERIFHSGSNVIRSRLFWNRNTWRWLHVWAPISAILVDMTRELLRYVLKNKLKSLNKYFKQQNCLQFQKFRRTQNPDDSRAHRLFHQLVNAWSTSSQCYARRLRASVRCIVQLKF